MNENRPRGTIVIGKRKFFSKRTGSWRGKKQKGDSDEREFDIVMENKKEQKILIGECKWRN